MSRDEDEKPGVARSDGEDEARAYAEAEVPEPSLTPTMEMDRVQVVDPRRAPTMRREDMLKASGPRAPEQTAPSTQVAPGVEAPLGLPGNKLQPLLFDQEFLEELRRKRAEAGEEKDPEGKAHETPANSPWSREAQPAEPVRASALASSFAPRPAPDAPAGERPGGTPARKRGTATTAITFALAAVGVALLVLASLRGHTTESGSQGPATAATMTAATATMTTTAVAPAVREMVTAPPQRPVEPAAPPQASATSTAAAAPPGGRVVPAAPTKASSEAEDPYPDGVKPIPAAARSAAPAVAPTTTTTTKTPPTATSAHPAPVSTVGKLVGGEE